MTKYSTPPFAVLASAILLSVPSLLRAQGPETVPVTIEGVMPVHSYTDAATWTKPMLPPAPEPRLPSHEVHDTWRQGPPTPDPTTPAGRVAGDLPGPLDAPMTILKNVQPSWSSQSTSTVLEPSLAQWGSTILYTQNWDAATSTNAGNSWTRRNPTNFGSVDGGFCCDQVAVKSPPGSNELVAWLLQYSKSTTTNTGSYRIAIFSTEARLGSGSSWSYVFNPGNLGWPAGYWMDYPSMTATSQYLYVTANVYAVTNAPDWGVVCWRMDLSDLKAGRSVRFASTRLVKQGQSWRLATASHDSDAAYWLFHNSSTAAYIYKWPDSGSVTRNLVTHGAYASIGGGFSGGDNRNFLGRSDNRGLTGWSGNGRAGFMWNSGARTNRPVPYVRAIEVDTSTLKLTRDFDLWSSTLCFAYPSTASNARGDFGGSITVCSATGFPSACVFAFDDQQPISGGLLAHVVGSGLGGPSSNAWGDYVTAQRHPVAQNTWIAANMAMNSSAGNNANQRPRYTWFGRSRDVGPLSDLIARELTATSTTLVPTATVAVTASYENAGDLISLPCRIGIYLSTNDFISTADTLLTTQSIATLNARQKGSFTKSFVVPDRTAATGSCWLGMIVDDTSVVAESEESNNTTSLQVTCERSKPDLVITFVTAQNTTAGSSSTYNATIKNQGVVATTQTVDLEVMLSTNSTWGTADDYVATNTVPPLAAGATIVRSGTWSAPYCWSSSTSFLVARVDAGGAVDEVSNTNNDRSTSMTISPYTGSGRYLQWVPRFGVTGFATSVADFRLVSGPRSGFLCTTAPQHTGEWQLVLWSGSPTFQIDALTNLGLGLLNGPILQQHFAQVPATGNLAPRVNLPNMSGIAPFQVWMHGLWFSADFRTVLGIGNSVPSMTIRS
ncbi:MAG: hypothetical protein KDC95_06345 [Planctomycetes bacterium]|nr:hypothetical protein [Planctomycetota bacterium]